MRTPLEALLWLQKHPALEKFRKDPDTDLTARIELSQALDEIEAGLKSKPVKRLYSCQRCGTSDAFPGEEWCSRCKNIAREYGSDGTGSTG
jgi:hypothetical protein